MPPRAISGSPDARVGEATGRGLRDRRLGAPHQAWRRTPGLSRNWRRCMPREHEWDARWWSPIINASTSRCARAPGLVDRRPSASSISSARARSRPSSGSSSPRPTSDRAGDLYPGPRRGTGVASAPDLDGHAPGPRPVPVNSPAARTGTTDLGRFADRMPQGAVVADPPPPSPPSASGAQRLRHPRLGDPRRRLAEASLPGTCREIGCTTSVLASRISYVGEYGWVSGTPDRERRSPVGGLLGRGRPPGPHPRRHRGLWHDRADREGIAPTATNSTPERTLAEAGMQRPKIKDQDFIGPRRSSLRRPKAPKAVLCSLTVDDPRAGRASSATCSVAS